MITIRDGAELDRHDGEVVQIVGRYSVTSTGRHKVLYERSDGTTGSTNRMVQLGLTDDVWVLLGVRPDDEMAALDGKTVIATGKLVAKPVRAGLGAEPDPQPTLVQITSVVHSSGL